MIKVADAVLEIVKRSPLIESGLTRGLINISALARDIKPQVEKRVFKDVTEGAIVMALKRLAANAPQHRTNHVFGRAPDMIVRSNLFELTLANSPQLLEKQRQILAMASGQRGKHFVTITSGVFETTVVASDDLRQQIKSVLDDQTVLIEITDLSSITIRLTDSILEAPGAYAHILKLIAWEGINIIEVVSTYLELTIILRQDDADRAFSALKRVFR